MIRIINFFISLVGDDETTKRSSFKDDGASCQKINWALFSSSQVNPQWHLVQIFFWYYVTIFSLWIFNENNAWQFDNLLVHRITKRTVSLPLWPEMQFRTRYIKDNDPCHSNLHSVLVKNYEEYFGICQTRRKLECWRHWKNIAGHLDILKIFFWE